MQEPPRNPSCKVVILGTSGVGKTSLINRWTTGTWSTSVKPTIGANHQRKTVELEDKKIDVFVWDTAGQEQFQSLTPLYARSAACAIITASITDQQSFDSLQTWVDLLRNACEVMPPLILAVNKIDMTEKYVMPQEDVEAKYGGMFGAIFFVSAKSGEGVDSTFTLAAQKGYEFNLGSQSTKTTNLTEKKKESKNGCC